MIILWGWVGLGGDKQGAYLVKQKGFIPVTRMNGALQKKKKVFRDDFGVRAVSNTL